MKSKSQNGILVVFLSLFAVVAVGLVVVMVFLPKTAPVETQTVTQIKPVREAKVVYIEGEVELVRGSSNIEIDMGVAILPFDTIVTGFDGYVELQFGNLGAARILPDSEIRVSTISLSPDSSSTGVEVVSGSILNKVRSLSPKDNYSIKTGETVCGVRGTEFLVTARRDGKGTKIAVKEGKVVVVAASPIVDDLLRQSQTNGIAQAAVAEIVAMAPVVGADQEIVVDAGAVEQATISYVEIARKVEETAPVPIETPVETAAVDTPLVLISYVPMVVESTPETESIREDVRDSMESVSPKTETISTDSVDVLKQIDTFQLLPTSMVVETPETAVSVGETVGPETVATPESPVTETTVVASPETASATKPSSAAAKPATTASVKPTTATTVPATTVKPTTATTTTLSAPTTTTLAAPTVGMGPILSTSAAAGKVLVGHIVQSGGVTLMADKSGTISAFDAKGKRTLQIGSSAGKNDMSYPVVFKGMAYFSSGSEFLCIGVRDGTVVFRKPLDSTRANLFGTRVVPYESKLLFPTNSSVDIVDPLSGAVLKSIVVPDNTNMSPAVWKSKIVIANMRGVFMCINPETGAIEWSVATGLSNAVALAPRIFGNLAVYADRKGKLVMIDCAKRTVVWTAQVSDGVFYDVEVQAEGVFTYSKDGTISGFSLAGAPLWEPIKGSTCPPLLSGGNLYYGDEAGNLVVVAATTRTQVGTLALGEVLSARPLIVEGVLWVAGRSGKVYRLDPKVIVAR